MENKELIIKYLKFKKDCVEENIIDIKEIQGLFKIKEELNQLS